MSKTRKVLFVALALFLVMPLATHAMSAKAEESVYVPKDQTVDGTLFSAGSSITIDGTVKGDVICAAQSVVINGTVDGDVICAGQSVTVNGKVGGSVRSAGNSVVLTGSVGRTAMMAGASVTISPQAVVGWDAVIGAANAQIGGSVKRDLYGAGSNMQITGAIGRHVALWLDENSKNDKDYSALTVAKDAVIGGNLTYTGRSDANIEDGASIKGEVTHNLRKDAPRSQTTSPLIGWIWFKIISIFAALVVGLVLAAWLPKPIAELGEVMTKKIWASLGWGLIFLVLTPIACLILLATIIGIPAALLLLGVWILLMYPAKVLAAIVIGKLLVGQKFLSTKYHNSLLLATVVGVVICWLIFSIPLVGWFLCFLAMLWGLGGIWQKIRTQVK